MTFASAKKTQAFVFLETIRWYAKIRLNPNLKRFFKRAELKKANTMELEVINICGLF